MSDFPPPPMMSCGHAANSIGRRPGEIEGQPACVICSCFDVATDVPDLTGRMARCTYYGRNAKGGWYNSNCCNVCKTGQPCQCEQPSSSGLWFFQAHPDKEYDEFYCACQGAD